MLFDTGSELQTPWLERLEPGYGLRERKNNWIPQPPHRYRGCRIQVGDLNNIYTACWDNNIEGKVNANFTTERAKGNRNKSAVALLFL